MFYETGIAHTLGKHVIPITQSSDDVPFDLRHHRYILYTTTVRGEPNYSNSSKGALHAYSNCNQRRREVGGSYLGLAGGMYRCVI